MKRSSGAAGVEGWGAQGAVAGVFELWFLARVLFDA
jgi:hypothetical protein